MLATNELFLCRRDLSKRVAGGYDRSDGATWCHVDKRGGMVAGA